MFAMFPSRFRKFDAESKTDEDFVYSAWLRSNKSESPFKSVHMCDYADGQGEVVKALLACGHTIILEHPTSEPKYGWICCEPGEQPLLHFIYVRTPYRNNGMGTALLKEAGVFDKEMVCTHWSKAIYYLRKKWKLKFNPFIAWRATWHK